MLIQMKRYLWPIFVIDNLNSQSRTLWVHTNFSLPFVPQLLFYFET